MSIMSDHETSDVVARTFHRFGDLPTELRDKIWDLAYGHPFPAVHVFSFRSYTRQPPPPQGMWVRRWYDEMFQYQIIRGGESWAYDNAFFWSNNASHTAPLFDFSGTDPPPTCKDSVYGLLGATRDSRNVFFRLSGVGEEGRKQFRSTQRLATEPINWKCDTIYFPDLPNLTFMGHGLLQWPLAYRIRSLSLSIFGTSRFAWGPGSRVNVRDPAIRDLLPPGDELQRLVRSMPGLQELNLIIDKLFTVWPDPREPSHAGPSHPLGFINSLPRNHYGFSDLRDFNKHCLHQTIRPAPGQMHKVKDCLSKCEELAERLKTSAAEKGRRDLTVNLLVDLDGNQNTWDEWEWLSSWEDMRNLKGYFRLFQDSTSNVPSI